jgi:hypothetical protein
MAKLEISGNQIVCRLSLFESLGAFHQSPKADFSALERVRKFDNPWSKEVLRGVRAPGTGFPYLIMLGTMRYRGGKDFCAIYKRKPVYVLEFESGEFKKWILSVGQDLPKLVQAKIGN